MHLTKTLKITVTGKTKKECEEVFTMIESICDTEIEEVDLYVEPFFDNIPC